MQKITFLQRKKEIPHCQWSQASGKLGKELFDLANMIVTLNLALASTVTVTKDKKNCTEATSVGEKSHDSHT